MSSEIPTILCHERDDFAGGMEFFCPYCSRLHLHGRGNGHRGAHCDDEVRNRRSNKMVPINSPYMETGYELVLAYPYDKAKEKIYSTKPNITIDTRQAYSYIKMDLDSISSDFTEEGKKKISEFIHQFDQRAFRKSWYRECTTGASLVFARVRKEVRFHIAQGLLDIATNPLYVKRRMTECYKCGKEFVVPDPNKYGSLRVILYCNECAQKEDNPE